MCSFCGGDHSQLSAVMKLLGARVFLGDTERRAGVGGCTRDVLGLDKIDINFVLVSGAVTAAFL